MKLEWIPCNLSIETGEFNHLEDGTILLLHSNGAYGVGVLERCGEGNLYPVFVGHLDIHSIDQYAVIPKELRR